jgi:DNA-binding MarR family transcriptional regulator
MSDGHLGLERVPFGASIVAVATQRLAQIVRATLSDVLGTRGELSLLEWRICVALRECGPVPQKEVVLFCRMQQAQVSRALSSMQNRRLIEAMQGREDRRSRLFILTSEGQALFERNRPDVERFCAAMDGALSAKERAQFLDMCERIAIACHDSNPADMAEAPAHHRRVN